MDIRTGKTYSTKEEALADGVPESDLAFLEQAIDNTHGLPRPSFAKPPKVKFTKGSFKPAAPQESK